ncbi:hypothetical protein CVV70_22065 [Ralstonia solanacearum]|nr:hypothetical protein CCY86_15010 [Ralstonia solanacearum]OPK49825.1 hypothetical protein B5J95_21735 [Ralstonia solanacearum]OPK50594.1 hypothetical protein B5G54_03585 [Ralstonia solanacearum]OPK56361.1 hypothetical protein B5S37_09050 [Ralstonia solanacearum]OYQ04891.1 hypothetical protein B7R79_01465 [Ralstonia solanacearum]
MSPVFSLTFSTCGASGVSSPAGDDLLSLFCQRKSAKKGAPDAATPSLQHKFKALHRAGEKPTIE